MAEQGQTKLTEQQRAINFLKRDHFLHNAVQISKKAVDLNDNSRGKYSHLLEKMLHSIFFLGNIHIPRFIPKEIFDDSGNLKTKLEQFEGPFQRYKNEVPVRTPFSYFLELVVRTSETDKEIRTVLSDTLQECQPRSPSQYTLISSVICVCEVSGRCYYGASLSCPGYVEGEIMTAVSCFHVRHPNVSSAVLSVFPRDRPEPEFPHGTIELPRDVNCWAFAINNLSVVKAACLRCHELYSLPTHSSNRNKPGNCAETEAISNVLKNERGVRRETIMNGRVLGRGVIQDRMRDHFNSKMRVGGRGERGDYIIERIFQ